MKSADTPGDRQSRIREIICEAVPGTTVGLIEQAQSIADEFNALADLIGRHSDLHTVDGDHLGLLIEHLQRDLKKTLDEIWRRERTPKLRTV